MLNISRQTGTGNGNGGGGGVSTYSCQSNLSINL